MVSVATEPKERRMMWRGTEMRKAKAQLLRMLVRKNMRDMVAMRVGGRCGRWRRRLVHLVDGRVGWTLLDDTGGDGLPFGWGCVAEG